MLITMEPSTAPRPIHTLRGKGRGRVHGALRVGTQQQMPEQTWQAR